MNTINKINDIIKQILIILLYFILTVGLQLLFYKQINSSNMFLANLSLISADLLVLLVFIFIFRKTIIPDFYDFKDNHQKYIPISLKYWSIGLLIMFISNMIITSFIGIPVNEEANREVLGIYPIYSFLTMVFISPIIEELMTRTILKDTFKHYIIYILLSGLIFGSLHITSVIISKDYLELLYIIPYGTLGCMFAKIYHDTNNVWSNIMVHMLHNFIAVLIVVLGSLL